MGFLWCHLFSLRNLWLDKITHVSNPGRRRQQQQLSIWIMVPNMNIHRKVFRRSFGHSKITNFYLTIKGGKCEDIWCHSNLDMLFKFIISNSLHQTFSLHFVFSTWLEVVMILQLEEYSLACNYFSLHLFNHKYFFPSSVGIILQNLA